jgi:hypothetical protein
MHQVGPATHSGLPSDQTGPPCARSRVLRLPRLARAAGAGGAAASGGPPARARTRARARGHAPAAVLLAEQHAHEAPGLRVLAGRAAGAHVAQRRQRARVAARHGRLELGALGDQVALGHDLRGGPAVGARSRGRAGAAGGGAPPPRMPRASPQQPSGRGARRAAPGAAAAHAARLQVPRAVRDCGCC